MSVRMLTAGESHGPGLTVILDGVPAGLSFDVEFINAWLRDRQGGYGRGGRQNIEQDVVNVQSGVRHGVTIGSPIALTLVNRDFANWSDVMSPAPGGDPNARAVSTPRPGHADLAGAFKYNLHNARNILERASARETAARVAAGAVTALLLRACGVVIESHVVRVGGVAVNLPHERLQMYDPSWWDAVEQSPLRCGDAHASDAMIAEIDVARTAKDTRGGVIETIAYGAPPGLGTHTQWDRRLDARVSAAIMSIPAIKGVEIGDGFALAHASGADAHDAITWDAQRTSTAGHTFRTSNHAGGIEGGMSNGEPIVVRAVMKPLSTLMAPLASIDMTSKTASHAHLERSDICALPAASVVARAMLAWVLADVMLEKCGGDTMEEVTTRVAHYRAQLAAW